MNCDRSAGYSCFTETMKQKNNSFKRRHFLLLFAIHQSSSSDECRSPKKRKYSHKVVFILGANKQQEASRELSDMCRDRFSWIRGGKWSVKGMECMCKKTAWVYVC